MSEYIVREVICCRCCKWWQPHGEATAASILAFGECKVDGRNLKTATWEFCFWGEREDDATND